MARIAIRYKKSLRCVQYNFDKLEVKPSYTVLKDKHINLTFDGVYFGRGLCYLVFRSNGQTIYYKQVVYETIFWIAQSLKEIEALGYTFKSFTIDGKKGLIEHLKYTYPNTQIQYCQFHQKQTIRQCITGNPKTECGKELKAFADKLQSFDYDSFSTAYAALKQRWEGYLKERNENKEFMHRKLRRAFFSLKRNAIYLFTYKHFESLKIPSTTNSCEGYFGQLKSKLRVHSGLRLNRKIKVIKTLLNNTTQT